MTTHVSPIQATSITTETPNTATQATISVPPAQSLTTSITSSRVTTAFTPAEV